MGMIQVAVTGPDGRGGMFLADEQAFLLALETGGTVTLEKDYGQHVPRLLPSDKSITPAQFDSIVAEARRRGYKWAE